MKKNENIRGWLWSIILFVLFCILVEYCDTPTEAKLVIPNYNYNSSIITDDTNEDKR